MIKTDLTEVDVCTNYISPAIEKAGWDMKTQVRREVVLTDGRIIVQGDKHHRGKRKRVDYILYHKANIPLAIIEVKVDKGAVDEGMKQALDYADILQVPFVFSSNGDGFLFHDKTISDEQAEKEISMDEFPSPEILWSKYLVNENIIEPDAIKIVDQDYHVSEGGMSLRYYQTNAINRSIEAVAKGQDRILLVMANGTGKTYTVFNIVWHLWKAGVKKRILFLADRKSILKQAMNGTFSPFGKDAMHMIKSHNIDMHSQVYFASYQRLTINEGTKKAYEALSKDFFDLVIIDECHRGSASEASAWREVLHYFSSATQIGLTATPKETRDVSNISYFGEPVYTYSLNQGINDGFLAPFNIIDIGIDDILKSEESLKDIIETEDGFPNPLNNDHIYLSEKRMQFVARKITEHLKETDRFAKTIVFCQSISHADSMRKALINENADLVSEHPNYVVKITSDDEVGKRELDNFTDVDERFPVIATTSKMLITGVDTRMVKLIVLDANVGSMTEFKQIIGRGTGINETKGKMHFSIMDFRKTSKLFEDHDFDSISELNRENVNENLVAGYDEKFVDKTGDGKSVEIIEDINDIQNNNTVLEVDSNTINTVHNPITIKDTVIPSAFDVELIAKEFAEQITNFDKETGQIVGILGGWGRGKTYFFKKVCDELNLVFDSKNGIKETDKSETETDTIISNFILIKFHAWKYQQTPAVWAHLYQVFIESYLGVGLIKKYWRIFMLNCMRKGHWNTWITSLCTIVFAILWYFWIPTNTKIYFLDSTIQFLGGFFAFVFLAIKISSFARFAKVPLKSLLNNFTDCPSYENLLGFQSEIQKEFKALLKSWIDVEKNNKKRILLFVDDIDRCSQDRMIDLVDALRVVLEDPEIISRMVVVLAADESKLKYAIKQKYREYSKEDGAKEIEHLKQLEKEYMDKLFIFCLKLPELNNEQRIEYLNKLIDEEGGVSDVSNKKSEKNSEEEPKQEAPSSVEEHPKPEVLESEEEIDFEEEIDLEDLIDSDDELDSEEQEKLMIQHVRITEEEMQYFQDSLKDMVNLSPRAIRIQYYRFLFARNLWLALNKTEFPYKQFLDGLFDVVNSDDKESAEIKYILEMVKAY